jgi:hypothetical protein
MAKPQHAGRTAAVGTFSSKMVTSQTAQASVSYALIVMAYPAIGSRWRMALTEASAVIG